MRARLKTDPFITNDDPNFGPSEIYYDTATARLAFANTTVNITWQGVVGESLLKAGQAAV